MTRSLWPYLANCQRGTEAVSPITHKELDPAPNHLSALGRGPPPPSVMPSDEKTVPELTP